MKTTTIKILNDMLKRYPILNEQKTNIMSAYEILYNTIKNGNKILICGNGGSAADSEHIVGELLKRFKKPRDINIDVFEKLKKSGEEGKLLSESLEGAIPAISLTSHISFSTAFSNDKNPELVFSQQLYALGNKGDTLISLSTSGNSKNCIYAIITAKAKDIKTISLTGVNDSRMSKLSDLTIKAPETETYLVQECHLPIYHCLCAMLEEELF